MSTNPITAHVFAKHFGLRTKKCLQIKPSEILSLQDMYITIQFNFFSQQSVKIWLEICLK